MNVIIGVGALGSHVATFIRNESHVLRIVDCDSIESKNTMSQMHGRAMIGKRKVQSMAQRALFEWGLKLDTIPHKLTSDNTEALLGGADLIIDCTDNAEARRIIQRYALAHNTPCLHGGLAADGLFGRVVWTEMFVPDEADPGVPTCEDGAHLPFIAFVSAQMALVVQRFLATGEKRSIQMTPGSITRIG